MKRTFLIPLRAILSLASSTASAHGPKGHQNLTVLKDQSHKMLDAGMKNLAKGLGVKCAACHVKGKYDRDDVPAKLAAREFMKTTIGEKDSTKRSAALRELLGALELEAAKNETKVWQAVDSWRLSPAIIDHATH